MQNSRAKTQSCSLVSDVIIREDNETRHSSHLAGITSPTFGWRKLLNPSSGICCTAPTTKLENCLYGGLKWDITFFLLGCVEFNAKGSFWGKDAKTGRIKASNSQTTLKQPNNFCYVWFYEAVSLHIYHQHGPCYRAGSKTRCYPDHRTLKSQNITGIWGMCQRVWSTAAKGPAASVPVTQHRTQPAFPHPWRVKGVSQHNVRQVFLMMWLTCAQCMHSIQNKPVVVLICHILRFQFHLRVIMCLKNLLALEPGNKSSLLDITELWWLLYVYFIFYSLWLLGSAKRRLGY